MNRFKLSGFVSLVPLLSVCNIAEGCCHNNGEEKRPNIIFILTDDQRWDALGYSGNAIIETPQLDRLAREGTYFRNAFSTTPISAASRASILTGLYERTHGYTFQKGALKDCYGQLCYPALLKENGYYTGFFGKFGVDYKKVREYFDVVDMYDRNDNNPNRQGYYYKTIDGDTVHLTRYTGYQALQFIKNAPADKPFCLSMNFSAPHAHDNALEQYIWQEKSDSRYIGITIPPPPLAEDKYFEILPVEVKEGFNRLRWTWRFDTPEKYQHSVKGYYRMISEIDDEIKQVRELLEEKGIADNTIIIFMGDNGYYLGERQLAGKWLMHENSIKVPLIIYDPRVKKHYDIDDMVLNIDVPKTILEYAYVRVPNEYQGIGLKSYVQQGKNKEKHEDILIEHLWELPQIPSSEGIRTERWKYFRYRFIDAPEELYDLKNDPQEINNLVGKKEYESVLNGLRERCNRLIEKYED
ncbi:MAG: Bifunctional sulfatase/alpha-L-rhamnosidase [Parabacteroides sp.]